MEAALSSAAVGLLARMLEHRSALSPLPAAADVEAGGSDLAGAELAEAGLVQNGAASERGQRVLDVLGDPDFQLTTLVMSLDFFLAGRYFGRGAEPDGGLVAFTPAVEDDLTRISYPVGRESIVGRLLQVMPQEEEPSVEWQLRLPLPAGLAFLGAVDVLRHRALRIALGEPEEPLGFNLDPSDVAMALDRASGTTPSHDVLSLVAQGLSIVPGEWKDDLETGLRLLADIGEVTGEGPCEAGGRMTDLARRLRLDTGAVALRLTRREGAIPRWERYVLVVGQRLPCLAVELIALDDGQAGLNLMFLGRRQLTELVGNFVLMLGERVADAEPGTARGPACAQCGAALDPDQEFCEECGAPVAPTQAHAGHERPCASCGEPLEADARFCEACGAKVD